MPTVNEWNVVNRRTALSHAISRSSTPQGGHLTADEIVKEAEAFRKFLDGESNG